MRQTLRPLPMDPLQISSMVLMRIKEVPGFIWIVLQVKKQGIHGIRVDAKLPSIVPDGPAETPLPEQVFMNWPVIFSGQKRHQIHSVIDAIIRQFDLRNFNYGLKNIHSTHHIVVAARIKVVFPAHDKRHLYTAFQVGDLSAPNRFPRTTMITKSLNSIVEPRGFEPRSR